LKLLELRSNKLRFTRFARDDGMRPLKLLNERSNAVSCVRLPSRARFDLLLMLQLLRYRFFNDFRLLIKSLSIEIEIFVSKRAKS
jgi:hypothetical protein